VTESQELVISGLNGASVVKADLSDLKEAWQKTLREL
jgi:hypothetical protein